VVIDIINILCAVVETKNHPPVSAYGHGPEASHPSFERMQAKRRQVHMGDGGGGVKRRRNVPQFANVLRVYAARIVLFKKAF